jgi:ubiquinone/menaquinone biosynthesis C-methylase UbiE
MDPSTVVMPPEMSTEAKIQAANNELTQEIKDLTRRDTYGAAVEKWNSDNAYLYALEYEYQQEDVELFVNFADLKEGQNVLDLGCGTGWVASAAKRIVGNQGKVVGVDCSGNMLQHALAFTIKEGICQKIEFYTAEISNLSSQPVLEPSQFFAGFDRILARRVLPLLPDQPDILCHWSKYLAPGGEIVTDINHPLQIVGAVTTARPWQAAEKRRTIEPKTTWKECSAYLHKIADQAGLNVLKKGYQYRSFADESNLYGEKAKAAWLKSGRSRNANDMTSRFRENYKRETLKGMKEETKVTGIRVYPHPVSMLAILKPKQ